MLHRACVQVQRPSSCQISAIQMWLNSDWWMVVCDIIKLLEITKTAVTLAEHGELMLDSAFRQKLIEKMGHNTVRALPSENHVSPDLVRVNFLDKSSLMACECNRVFSPR